MNPQSKIDKIAINIDNIDIPYIVRNNNNTPSPLLVVVDDAADRMIISL